MVKSGEKVKGYCRQGASWGSELLSIRAVSCCICFSGVSYFWGIMVLYSVLYVIEHTTYSDMSASFLECHRLSDRKPVLFTFVFRAFNCPPKSLLSSNIKLKLSQFLYSLCITITNKRCGMDAAVTSVFVHR